MADKRSTITCEEFNALVAYMDGFLGTTLSALTPEFRLRQAVGIVAEMLDGARISYPPF